MKPLVIYHGGGCTDGFCAAFAAWLKLGDEAEYLPMEYLKNTDGVAEFHERVKIDCSISERDVYILDFSLPKVVMYWLFSHAKRVVWLDHHKTAFEMMDRTPGELYRVHDAEQCIILDNNKSGAMLAWEYFHPGTEVPVLIQHIDDLASDLGHELANKSGTFGLVWSMAGDGQIHCSLRSNGDYDVSAIAKAFGGGGHRNAAGFSTDIDTLMSWLK